MNYHTAPIPVFPTPGAQPWTTRTPMAEQVEEATERGVIVFGNRTGLPEDLIRDLALEMVRDFLDEYARNLEKFAMEVSVEHPGLGVAAVWHGTDYTLISSPIVPPGHLVEERCTCRDGHGRRAAGLN